MQRNTVVSRTLRFLVVLVGLSAAPIALSPSQGIKSNDACGEDQSVKCCWRWFDTCYYQHPYGLENTYEYWGGPCP